MPYSVLDDIKAALPESSIVQLTDDKGLGQIDSDKVTKAIEQADGEIDIYLAPLYSVPLSSVPAMIKRCSCDIAIYILYKRKLEEITETRLTSYKDAIRTLEKISRGEIKLPVSAPDAGDFASGILVTSHFE